MINYQTVQLKKHPMFCIQWNP